MRIFDIRAGDEFTEYSEVPFQVEHNEAILENWLESNPDSILENSRILITGRQVSTNLSLSQKWKLRIGGADRGQRVR